MHRRLGRILLDRNIITRAELNGALAQQQDGGGLIGDLLVELGVARCQIDCALMMQLLEVNAPGGEGRA